MSASVFAALCEHLNTLSHGLPVNMPNTTDPKPTSGAWLKVNDLPAEPVQISNGWKRLRGLFQVSVFWPEGEGELKAKEVADTIVDHFDVKSVIEFEGQIVRVLRPPAQGPALDEPGWTQIPVRIPYTADVSI